MPAAIALGSWAHARAHRRRQCKVFCVPEAHDHGELNIGTEVPFTLIGCAFEASCEAAATNGAEEHSCAFLAATGATC